MIQSVVVILSLTQMNAIWILQNAKETLIYMLYMLEIVIYVNFIPIYVNQ